MTLSSLEFFYMVKKKWFGRFPLSSQNKYFYILQANPGNQTFHPQAKIHLRGKGIGFENFLVKKRLRLTYAFPFCR